MCCPLRETTPCVSTEYPTDESGSDLRRTYYPIPSFPYTSVTRSTPQLPIEPPSPPLPHSPAGKRPLLLLPPLPLQPAPGAPSPHEPPSLRVRQMPRLDRVPDPVLTNDIFPIMPIPPHSLPLPSFVVGVDRQHGLRVRETVALKGEFFVVEGFDLLLL